MENAEQLAGLRVLVADASASERARLQAMLEELGCRCDMAADGLAAVELAGDRAFDLILVDVDLPLLNGAQCRQAIEALPGRHGRAPVVALQPATTGAARVKHLQAEGFVAALQRPIELPALRSCLTAHGRPAVAGPAIDLGHLRRYTLGERELERELLQAFLPSAAGYLEAMARAVDDPVVWREKAHALKGAARGIGAFALGDLAEHAERERADLQPEARQRLLAALGAALSGVEAFVAAHLGGDE